jgi:hypothetical protein
MIVETRAEQGDCDVCGGESRLPMLVPWTWVRVAPHVVHDVAAHVTECGSEKDRCRCGVLCQSCAEHKLGRELTIGDFTHSVEIARAISEADPSSAVRVRYKKTGSRIREVSR